MAGRHPKTANKLEKSGFKTKIVARGHKTTSVTWLQPWFLSKPISIAIRRLIPHQYDSKMRWYFEDYGCFNCKKKKVLYAANGFCINCMALVRSRLMQSMKRRMRNPIIPQMPEPNKWFFSRAEAAEKLLSEFVKKRTWQAAEASALRLPQPRPRHNP